MQRTALKSDFSSDMQCSFRELALEFQELAADAGVTVTPFIEPSLPLFSKLDIDGRRRAVFSLDRAVQICRQVRAQGHRMTDSPALVWAALKEMGLRPPSDLFGHIGDDSIVEVHSREGVQIFRNFNFYRYCSYSLEELYCGAWNTLYERDETITQRIIQAAMSVYSRETRSTTPIDIPEHQVREVFSPLRHEILLKMEWIAPLFREGSHVPEATIVIESARYAKALPDSRETGPKQDLPYPDRWAAKPPHTLL